MLQVTQFPFNLVGPGQTTTGVIGFTSPADASYSAAITGDQHSIFKVLSISALRPTLEDVIDDPVDPGDGVKPKPRKHHKELVDEPVGSSNGVTPLSVLKGDKLFIKAQMVCPADPDDAYSAVLSITSSNSADSTTVVLTVPTGQVDVQPFNKEAIAAPGSAATWVLLAESLAGRGANMSVAPELGGSFGPPPSVSIPPINTFLPRRGHQALALTATVGNLTPPGSYKFFVAETIFDGADTFSPFDLSLTVTDPLVIVTTDQPGAFQMVQGSQIEFALRVQTTGSTTFLDLTIDPTPPGLTCTFLGTGGQPTPDFHFPLQQNQRYTLPVRVSLALDAPISNLPLTLSWSAYNGTEQGKLNVGVTVLPQAIVFGSGILGPSTTTASAFWSLNAQGFWNFTGNIHESGLIGHDYCLGMALNVKDKNGNGLGVVHSGSVAANLGLGGNDDPWSDKGFDQRIIDLWPAIVAARSSSTLNATTDLGHIVAAVLEALGIGALALLIAAGVALLGGDGKEWECPPPQVHGEGSNEGFGFDVKWTCHPKQ